MKWVSRLGVTAAASAALVLALSIPAAAAQPSAWATWATGGAEGAITGTATLPTGFGEVTFSSDSQSADTPSGASMWVGEGTAPGDLFGSSRDTPYLTLGLAPTGTPSNRISTTVYTFPDGTPTNGWAIVLGDIDADMITVTAIDTDGNPVRSASLLPPDGTAGAPFSMCAASPKPSGCSGVNEPFDVPNVTQDGSSVTILGSQGADSVGAAAWLMPRTSLRTLTVVFTDLTGFPSYTTQFVSALRTISGTVTVEPTEPASGVTIALRDEAGDVVSTTTTDSSGAYSFADLAPRKGWTVSVTTPDGYELVGDATLSASLAEGNARDRDFALRVASPDTPDTLPATPDTLPATGGDAPWELGTAAIGLVLAGAVLLGIHRRRSTSAR